MVLLERNPLLVLVLSISTAAFLSEAASPGNNIENGCKVQADLQRQPLVLFLDQKAKWNLDMDSKVIEEKLGKGFSELCKCNFEDAWKIFDEVSQEKSQDSALLGYLGKAVTSARKNGSINKSVAAAVEDLEKAAKIMPDHALVLQSQVEIQFRSGDAQKAMETARKLIDKFPDGHALVLAGIIAFKNDLHYDAVQYLNKALKYEAGSQPIVHQCLGLSYMALGMIKKSIEALLDCLEMQPNDNPDVLRALGTAFKELGIDKTALEYLDGALSINSRDVKALIIKGHIHFSSGKIEESLKDYQACLYIEPDHYGCQYMKALSLAMLGRFYESVKASTRVMISNFGAAFVPEYSQSFYLREFARYLHSKLDTPLKEYRFESDLSPSFREMWIKNLPWNVKNYTEQPGIQPHISDVEQIQFENLSDDAKLLLCKAATYEELLQYHSDGFMPNWRLNKAMALGVLDVAQTALHYWRSPVSLRGWKGKRFTWRDIFDVSLKWRKLVSMWYPALWLDLFPKKVVESGMSNQVLFTVGNHQMFRFMPYFRRVFDLAKSMIRKIFAQKLNAKAQEELQKASDVKELVSLLRKASLRESFGVALQIPSARRKTSQLDGVLVTMSGQRVEDMSFLLESISKPVRSNQFHSELEYLWGKLADDVSKQKNAKDPQSDINTILTMVYYFYNFVPLSKGSSAVAYTVAVGLLLAIGQEVTGPIPVEKQPDLEAILSNNPEAFIKTIQRWLGLSRIPLKQVQSLPSVAQTFPTSRSILEALNTEIDHEYCKKKMPEYSKRDS